MAEAARAMDGSVAPPVLVNGFQLPRLLGILHKVGTEMWD
jgi:hypothetical protein